MSIFTEDYPDVGIDRALRLGYKLPFKTIMPSYIKNTKFFSDLFDAIDEVFDKHVYNQIFLLKNIRNMWLSNPQLEQKIMDAKELISLEDWTLPSNEVVVKQLNTLGLQLGKSASLFNNKDYLAFCRFIGQYWYEKGTGTFMDFVNFCCGADYTFVNAWTKDYSKFYKEGDSAIGTPIWEGGEWYPTTHVRFVSKNNYNADVHIIAVLFNEIANYNLVLASIEQEFSFGPEPGGEGGSGGALALATADRVWMFENSIYSVLSPEGYASIVWKDAKRVADAAEELKLTPEILLTEGIIDKIIPEVVDQESTKVLKNMLVSEVESLRQFSADELVEQRHERFSKF